MATRAEAFDDLVADTAQRFRGVLGKRWAGIEFAVEDVPPSDPAGWEDAVPLARLWPAQGPLPARIVVYRRPIETIVRGGDHVELVHEVMVEQVALLLGVDPDEVDPDRR
ncbi:peptidase [Janibacter sp. Soil728]|uniref:metallopeptidase family protein n=1 Tax=Janibacter sp. Soil728 TaxID=1736393 RepID=UPI0006F5D7D4|nr:metallopeptidase family protein [Janibacter sp. Soil728]KRE38083.1 peptidase [Janibacter sp. Soil728]